MMNNGYGSGYGSVGWAGWLTMVAMMVVFWGAIAWVVVTLIRNSGNRAQLQPERRTDPIGILDERFARGEIDEDEYQRRREAIRGTP
jgi:putative membrane protein